ncbi:MAG: lytic murein transglycosylase [Solirubrobacteraceae bacterium]
MLVTLGVAALPTASAAGCTVTVKLVNGEVDNFSVPAGTPVSAVTLPTLDSPVVSETESCTPTPSSTPSSSSASKSSSTSSSSSTSTSASPSSSSSSSSSTTTTSTTSSGGPKPGKSKTQQSSSKKQPATHHKSKAKKKPNSTSVTTNQKKAKKKAKLPSGAGVPSPKNPTYSLSLPGPAPIGVPNFFIDSFQIPPFLIPIYQAAGIEYNVPWQVLAAINEIETDYGRNLSVSSAGAVGWMQFLPSTWKEWGVDANGDGVADPYNPVDAIFTAARYLHAAGASKSISNAIFSYNHAGWYVQSVLLRAKLIGGIPSQLVGALSGLVQGHFPVAAPAKYADDSVVSLAKHRVKGSNASIPIDSNPSTKGTSIFAKQGSPVIAVNDGKIIKIGDNAQLGHYIELQDETGNIYTYSQLGTVSKTYPVPKPVKLTARDIAKELSAPPPAKTPVSPASAGSQANAPTTLSSTQAQPASVTPTHAATAGHPAASHDASKEVKSAAKVPASAQSESVSAPMVKERLFANPSRKASYAAGGSLQLKNNADQISNFENYFSDTLHLARSQYTLKPLKAGSIVIAGTVLGKLGGPTQGLSSHLYFTIQPAGKKSPDIDPKPILDGWKLLEATAVYRAAGVDPFFGPGAKNPSVGQVLLMSKEQLTARILQDPRVQIYNCGRRDIAAGLIDRQVLATIEFLSASGLDPYVSGLDCGHSVNASTGVDEQGASGASVDISKINNIPILGHQGAGSVTDITIRRLLTLQGSMRPDYIISDVAYKGQSNTLALPDHKNRIQITFTPNYGPNRKLSAQVKTLLQPNQWVKLINQIGKIPEPVVPIAPSKYAIKSHAG